MSIIQAILASTPYGSFAPQGAFPVVGEGYPAPMGTYSATGTSRTIEGYNSVASPITGLYRRVFNGLIFPTIGGGVSGMRDPSTLTLAEESTDPFVGFGFGNDDATNYSVEWTGYFVVNQTGNYNIAVQVDDDMAIWMGDAALNPTTSNHLFYVSNGTGYIPSIANGESGLTSSLSLISGKLYPIRIRYTEGSGAHNATICAGLDGQSLVNNGSSVDWAFCHSLVDLNNFNPQ